VPTGNTHEIDGIFIHEYRWARAKPRSLMDSYVN
jgi:hypothetical protein